MESFLTKEQKDKLSTLRFENDKPFINFIHSIRSRNVKKEVIEKFSIGDKVSIKLGLVDINCTITSILDSNYYDVTTVKSVIIHKVFYNNIKRRTVVDYTKKFILNSKKERLSGLSDKNLLNLLKICRVYNHPAYTLSEIKYELSLRGHIKRKDEILDIKRDKNISKLKEIVKRQKDKGIKDSKAIQRLKKMLK